MHQDETEGQGGSKNVRRRERLCSRDQALRPVVLTPCGHTCCRSCVAKLEAVAVGAGAGADAAAEAAWAWRNWRGVAVAEATVAEATAAEAATAEATAADGAWAWRHWRGLAVTEAVEDARGPAGRRRNWARH